MGFTCDNCGREFDDEKMKEAFRDGDGDGSVVREELCPECLDTRMNEAVEVYGVNGQEKRRAAYLAEHGSDQPPEPVTGRRGN